MQKVLTIVALLFFHGLAFSATIFENSTEDSTKQWKTASKHSVNLTLNSINNRAQLDAELKENGLQVNHSRFLVEKTIKLSNLDGNYKFIRPTNDPYISFFYGAHVFRYWIISDKKIIFSSSSDSVSILSTSHHGMKDIVTSNYRGGYMYNETYRFGVNGYQAYSCQANSVSEPAVIFDCSKESP
ncbi:MAG: hypothetical protein LBV61_01160 [Burkholderiaceae bacterium]|jgi:hypothetical protein|nr:hypothetical protein [Burkholderiaceae bacterium]